MSGWFPRHDQLVFFLAAGAVTRLIAPCLLSKESDPGVLAIDEGGHFVIPVLSGHRGGANAFARTVAGYLGATPVVTTASDVVDGLSLDVLEETFCWTAEPRERLKDMAMALVNKEPVAFIQEIGTRGTWLEELNLPENVTVAVEPAQVSASITKVLWVSERHEAASLTGDSEAEPERPLVSAEKPGAGCGLRKRSIAIGIGKRHRDFYARARLRRGLHRYAGQRDGESG